MEGGRGAGGKGRELYNHLRSESTSLEESRPIRVFVRRCGTTWNDELMSVGIRMKNLLDEERKSQLTLKEEFEAKLAAKTKKLEEKKRKIETLKARLKEGSSSSIDGDGRSSSKDVGGSSGDAEGVRVERTTSTSVTNPSESTTPSCNEDERNEGSVPPSSASEVVVDENPTVSSDPRCESESVEEKEQPTTVGNDVTATPTSVAGEADML